MNHLKLVLAIVLLSFLITGCAEQDGPAENAGEQIDETVDRGQGTLEEITEDAAEKAEEAGDAIKESAEQMGEKIDEAMESGKDAMDDAFEQGEENIEEAGDAIEEETDEVSSGY